SRQKSGVVSNITPERSPPPSASLQHRSKSGGNSPEEKDASPRVSIGHKFMTSSISTPDRSPSSSLSTAQKSGSSNIVTAVKSQSPTFPIEQELKSSNTSVPEDSPRSPSSVTQKKSISSIFESKDRESTHSQAVERIPALSDLNEEKSELNDN
ncbi:unnamed protein product, partial [Rotaria magnacalcarata]